MLVLINGDDDDSINSYSNNDKDYDTCANYIITMIIIVVK